MKNIKIILTLLFFLTFCNMKAQGCSDAGFCSVGNSFKDVDTTVKNTFEIGTVYGIGEEDVINFSQYITYSRIFSEHFSLSSKITSSLNEGSFGERSNVGDIFLTGNYRFNTQEEAKSKWSILLGGKIPLTSGNDKINGISLPMAYQSSLGTYDLIAGVDLAIKKWEFSTAVQIPLTQNKNSYFSEYAFTDKFNSTNLYERKSDVLFRTTYKIKTANQKFIFRPNALFIYHLGNDSFENIYGQRETIKNSDGFTINGNLIITYKVSKNGYLETSLATPFVVRKEKPDGLARAFTFGLSYKQNF